MDPHFAVQFVPESDGATVALDAFAETLNEISEGFESLSRALSPLIAEKVKWPIAGVRDYLRVSVRPITSGSVVVPVVIGSETSGYIGSERVAPTFWRYSAAVLKGAARQRVGVADVPASCAEHFVSASRVARERGRSRLRLVHRNYDVTTALPPWRSSVDLTRIEQGLAGYADRRATRRSVATVLIGRVKAIVWDPPQLQLEMASGQTRQVQLTAGLRNEARELWGSEVVAHVEANITPDGEIRDMPKAQRIQKTTRIQDLAQELKETFGVGRDVWGTQEAEDYLKSLRRDS